MKKRFLLLFLISLFLVACERVDENREAVPPETRFPLTLEGVVLRTELALTDSERSRGLMFREELPADQGMLFVFDRPETRSFFMRNTSIPLDLGYFDQNGVLREIHALFPYDETPVPSRSNAIQFALEVNRGWFRQHGIRADAQLDLGEVARAIEARGLDPTDFRLAVPSN